jgi:hypothetical protein
VSFNERSYYFTLFSTIIQRGDKSLLEVLRLKAAKRSRRHSFFATV